MSKRLWPQALPVAGLAVLAMILLVLSGRSPSDRVESRGVAMQTDDARQPELEQGQSPEFNFPPLAVFDAVVEDNLFSATRTAPPEGPERTAAPQQENVQLSLSGVVLSGDKRSAILMDNATARMMNITIGESFRGWELVSVDQHGAVIRQNGAEVSLLISFAPDNGEIRGPGGRLQINPRLGSGGPISVVPRRGDSQGNPVPARRQSIDPDRIEKRGGRI